MICYFPARDTGRVPTRRFVTHAWLGFAMSARLSACASTDEPRMRVLVTLAPGVQVADQTEFEQRVLARSSVKVAYAGAVSERVHALNITCAADDAGCEHTRSRLLASGLFTSVADDGRRRRY
jgi:hypothetical protein